MTRRDKCYFIARRMKKLNTEQAALAWNALAHKLEDDLSVMDLPKFRHLLKSVRLATMVGKLGGIPACFKKGHLS